MSDYNNEIAMTILEQLGGNRFAAITGSNTFVAIKDGICMKLARNSSGANYLRITLLPTDLYKMEFILYRKACVRKGRWIDEVNRVVCCFEGVYCDMLQELFTQVTGLYTHL